MDLRVTSLLPVGKSHTLNRGKSIVTNALLLCSCHTLIVLSSAADKILLPSVWRIQGLINRYQWRANIQFTHNNYFTWRQRTTPVWPSPDIQSMVCKHSKLLTPQTFFFRYIGKHLANWDVFTFIVRSRLPDTILMLTPAQKGKCWKSMFSIFAHPVGHLLQCY